MQNPQVKVRANLFVQMLFNFGRLCMSRLEKGKERSAIYVERVIEAQRLGIASTRSDFCTFQVVEEGKIEFRVVTFIGHDEEARKFYDQLEASEGARVIVPWPKEPAQARA